MIELETKPMIPHLCRREQQVAQMILRGMLQKEMAEELGINVKTVEKYVQALYFKFHVNSRVAFVRAALRTGYTTLADFLSHTDGENKVHAPPQRYERITFTPRP